MESVYIFQMQQLAILHSLPKQCIWRYSAVLSLRAKHFACSSQVHPSQPDKVMDTVRRKDPKQGIQD